MGDREVGIEVRFSARKARDAVAIGFKQPAQGITNGLVVIDDKHRFLSGDCAHSSPVTVCCVGWWLRASGPLLPGPSASPIGKLQWNVAPVTVPEASILFTTQRRPQCDSMIDRQMFKPMPIPSDLVL